MQKRTSNIGMNMTTPSSSWWLLWICRFVVVWLHFAWDFFDKIGDIHGTSFVHQIHCAFISPPDIITNCDYGYPSSAHSCYLPRVRQVSCPNFGRFWIVVAVYSLIAEFLPIFCTMFLCVSPWNLNPPDPPFLQGIEKSKHVPRQEARRFILWAMDILGNPTKMMWLYVNPVHTMAVFGAAS